MTGGSIGFQRWDSLLFLHWAVDPAILRPLVPARLSIDSFEGFAYITITPFTVRGARMRFLPRIPSLSTFHEVNVRTYVHLEGRDPGVWFFSLDAASPLAVALARLGLGLPYRHARIERSSRGDEFGYGCRRVRGGAARAELRASWRSGGGSRFAATGSLEHFLVERYFLYSRGPLGKLWSGPVRHAPWPLRHVRDLCLTHSLDRADGLPSLTGEPLAHHSEGVDVDFLPFRLV